MFIDDVLTMMYVLAVLTSFGFKLLGLIPGLV